MPSSAQIKLARNLGNIGEIREAYKLLTGGTKGAPPITIDGQRLGAAVTKSGVILLAASFEAFVEDLFEEAIPFIFPTLTQGQLSALLSQSSRRMNNADCDKIENLFDFAALPKCLDGIRWQKFETVTLRKNINQFVHIRNCIAHGGPLTQSKNNNAPFNLVHGNLTKWKRMVENFSPRFENRIKDHIRLTTGVLPPW